MPQKSSKRTYQNVVSSDHQSNRLMANLGAEYLYQAKYGLCDIIEAVVFPVDVCSFFRGFLFDCQRKLENSL